MDVVVTLLAATDPANPYGAALPWPAPVVPHEPGDGGGHRPGRKAGAAVVLVAGALALFVERGGRSILSFTDDPDVLRHACERLATEIRSGSLGRVVLTRADGIDLLGPHRPTTRLAAALTDAGFAPTPRGLRLSGQR
jgi:ATP-dependent Lhr-like helicase